MTKPVVPAHQQLPRPRVIVVDLPEEIDISNARQVRQSLADACGAGTVAVVADMTRTTFCDSTGMSAVVLAHQHAARVGTEMSVVIAGASVRRVFRLLGLHTVVPAYSSIDAALAAAGTRSRLS